jgi:hypothetical protein
MAVDDSTLAGVGAERPAGLWLRRAALTALAGIVALGAVGLLGLHTSSVSTTGGGYSLDVDYPRVARAGLDVTLRVTVTRPGGFDHDVTLAVSGDYFPIYETQGFFPTPSDTTRDASNDYFTFTKPPGETLVVDYDAYIQPSSQRGASATIAVLDDGRPAASVYIETALLP